MFCVLEIHRMSIHNGPGIRTMVHFKGCPLKCDWCSTPESQDVAPQLFYRRDKCIGCGACIELCAQKSISFSEENRAVINWKSCNNCLRCTKVCNSAALRAAGMMMSGSTLLDEILKDQLFYDTSGGGVVFSGGEPMMSFTDEFLWLLSELKKHGVSIGIDTSGHTQKEYLEKILPYVDYFLWDLKQMDSRKHRVFTGVGNERILDNLKYVDDNEKEIYLRCPIIADYNDEVEHFKEICKLALELKHLKEIHIIPMHHMGASRYESIGKQNPIENKELLEASLIEEKKKYAEQQGFVVKVIN